jgi:hypothetical protein
MKLTKEDIQKFATEDEKKSLKEDKFKPEDWFAADRDRVHNMELLKQDIALAKKKIITHHKRHGAHEMGVRSWVDKLVGKLEDKWRINDLVYSGYQLERKMAELLKDFWTWAVNYEGGPNGVNPEEYYKVKESKELSERRRGYIPLYIKQKKIIDRFIEEHYHDIKRRSLWFNVDDWPELYDEVATIRETETLYQDINRYVSDKLSEMPRREWEENFDPYITDEERESLLEANNYDERTSLKESLANNIAMKHIEDSQRDLDIWEDDIRKMSPEELDETEFEFKSARDNITWKIQKWTIPGEHREGLKNKRKLYQKYLNRLRKVKKEIKLSNPVFSKKDPLGFGKAINSDRIKNMSDEESEMILKMFK